MKRLQCLDSMYGANPYSIPFYGGYSLVVRECLAVTQLTMVRFHLLTPQRVFQMVECVTWTDVVVGSSPASLILCLDVAWLLFGFDSLRGCGIARGLTRFTYEHLEVFLAFLNQMELSG